MHGAGQGIGVRLVAADGRPLMKTQVSLSGPQAWVGVTDDDGRFYFKDLKRGTYRVSTRVSGRPSYWFSHDAQPGQTVTLRLPSGPARLRIRLDMKLLLEYYNQHILSREALIGLLGSFGIPAPAAAEKTR